MLQQTAWLFFLSLELHSCLGTVKTEHAHRNLQHCVYKRKWDKTHLQFKARSSGSTVQTQIINRLLFWKAGWWCYRKKLYCCPVNSPKVSSPLTLSSPVKSGGTVGMLVWTCPEDIVVQTCSLHVFFHSSFTLTFLYWKDFTTTLQSENYSEYYDVINVQITTVKTKVHVK